MRCSRILWAMALGLSAGCGREAPQQIPQPPAAPRPASPDAYSSLRHTLKGHTRPVHSVAFSPDGHVIASGGDDHTVRLWDVASADELAVLSGHTDTVFDVAFSSDGKLLASGSEDGTARIWDVGTRKVRKTLSLKDVNALALHPRKDVLATASVEEGKVVIKLWDPGKGASTLTFPDVTYSSRDIAFSPDGEVLASADETGAEVELWKVETGKKTAALKTGFGRYPFCVAFDPRGRYVAAGTASSPTGDVQIWDVATGQPGGIFPHRDDLADRLGVRSAAFSPDGKILASGQYNHPGVALWDVATQQNIATLEGHDRGVLSVAFSRDGKHLASGSQDGTIKVWGARARKDLWPRRTGPFQ